MLSYKFAYLIGNLFVMFPVWLVLLLRRKDLRKEIISFSILGGIAGPLSELWYLRDYWKPELMFDWKIGFEDFLFGFFIAGIAASLYEEVFAKHFTKRRSKQKYRYLLAMSLGLLLALIMNTLTLGFKVNTIYASSIGFLVLSLIILIKRRDLLVDAVISGLLVGLFMFLSYMVLLAIFPQLIHKWWYLENISNILILGVPIEELLWAFSWGMLAGPAYEFFAGLKFRKE